MNKEKIEELLEQERILESEISDLWAFGKKSKSKEKKLESIKNLIKNYELINYLKEEVIYYKIILNKNNINFKSFEEYKFIENENIQDIQEKRDNLKRRYEEMYGEKFDG